MIAFAHGGRQAVFQLRQILRPDAIPVMSVLRAFGFDLRIFSGDRAPIVGTVAQSLGVQEWRAGQRPDDKIAAIEQLRARGRRVLMVGDGINDAPALAAATASMAPISAADVTQASADAIFWVTSSRPCCRR